MKDEESVLRFANAKVGDVIKFNPTLAYPNKADFASMLNITKEVAETVINDFNFTITEINRFTPAELNEELFAKVYPAAELKDADAFKALVSEEISKSLLNDQDYKFALDAKTKFVKKCNVALPEAFLKRWILTSNKEVTKEQVDAEFPHYADDIRWQIIKSKIIQKNNLSVSQEEITEMAKTFAQMQMQQYGIANLPDEQLEAFALKILESEKERKSITEKASEGKVISHIKASVKLDDKAIEVEDFNKMFE
jgi:trigger factor